MAGDGGFPLPGLGDVPGFLTAPAAWLLDGLARWQAGRGMRGGVAEIGVFYGRSALVLGRALAPGERLVACDRFDVGAGDVPGWSFREARGPEEALRARWREWVGDEAGLVVLRRDSADLAPGDLGACPRLVHVDGGHGYDDVRRDLLLAERALDPGGAIVLDDVLLPEWPDVTVAVVDHLRARPGALAPVAVAEHKLVVCRAPALAEHRAWAAAALPAIFAPPRFLVAERTFVGAPVLVATRLPG
ncbi:class I SAM-dependent methyltransferase [Miltoncostaea marina]|uniref:class I SAM-dependent methyltransferase n=1 Tax=Miltoncostaea marina TaxID=2843215 RepID=UPI001C3D5FF9|nr:class I SAM-dependent methyltransferase [Miltoncostaea marina]